MMRKFRNNVSDGWLFKQELRLWRNFARNWDRDVEAGKRLFFERMFKTKLTEEEVAELKVVRNLAPGDFRTVRQSMYYLGGAITNSQWIAALAKESEVKKDTRKAGRIGFG